MNRRGRTLFALATFALTLSHQQATTAQTSPVIVDAFLSHGKEQYEVKLKYTYKGKPISQDDLNKLAREEARHNRRIQYRLTSDEKDKAFTKMMEKVLNTPGATHIGFSGTDREN